MRFIRQIAGCLLLWLIAMAVLPVCYAQTWTDPATQLTHKIIGKIGLGSSIAFTLTNNSSLSAADVNDVRAQLLAQFRQRTLKIVEPSQAEAEVAVTLSENIGEYVWIANIRQGETSYIVMVAVPRATPGEPHTGSGLALHSRLLHAQVEPILDVAALPGIGIVLSPSKVTYYRVDASGWQEMGNLSISQSRPFPRDVRGRIWPHSQYALEVSLPGLKCIQATAQETSLNCSETDDSWPIGRGNYELGAFFSPVRNFFSGTLTSKGSSFNVPRFFSAAIMDVKTSPSWISTGVDGRISFFNGVNTLPLGITNWGSDIAGVVNHCGVSAASRQDDYLVLATGNGDYTQADSAQAFRMNGREAIPATAPVDFAGPITALWPDGNDPAAAIAIAHNLKTGKYEAYSLSLACN